VCLVQAELLAVVAVIRVVVPTCCTVVRCHLHPKLSCVPLPQLQGPLQKVHYLLQQVIGAAAVEQVDTSNLCLHDVGGVHSSPCAPQHGQLVQIRMDKQQLYLLLGFLSPHPCSDTAMPEDIRLEMDNLILASYNQSHRQ